MYHSAWLTAKPVNISNTLLMNNLSPHVQVNPFKDRICKVFSSSKDGELTFEDFLDMMSVFSENVSYLEQ